jgi:Zn-dependent alcohol dehydrogenase
MQLKPPYMEDKYTLGHEGAGEVIEIGSKVPSGRFKVGDRIAVLSVAGCQEQSCGECSRGKGVRLVCRHTLCMQLERDVVDALQTSRKFAKRASTMASVRMEVMHRSWPLSIGLPHLCRITYHIRLGLWPQMHA